VRPFAALERWLFPFRSEKWTIAVLMHNMAKIQIKTVYQDDPRTQIKKTDRFVLRFVLRDILA
jgi:hypothetical protein